MASKLTNLLRRHRKHVAAVAIGVLVIGAAVGIFFAIRDTPHSFAATIRKADRVILYEGLPHQHFEKENLERERRTKAHFEWGGFSFYEESLELGAADVERLRELLGEPGAYEPWKGERLCGGFHPDYVLEWHVGSRRYRMLMCFGCGEFMLSGPWTWRWSRLDMDIPTGQALVEVLKGYRKNRPR